MKKTLTTLGVLLLFSISKAQTSFGIHVAGIAANQKVKSEYELKNLLTWKFGLLANIPVASKFSLMPQLNVVNKGTNLTGLLDEGSGNYSKTKFSERLSYVEMPVYFLYRFSANMNRSFYAGLGPVLAYGASGIIKGTQEHYRNGYTSTELILHNIRYKGYEDITDNTIVGSNTNMGYVYVNRLDIGSSVIAGYQWGSGIIVNAHYTYGFSNINPDHQTGKVKNNYFGLGIGYLFHKK